MTRRRRRILIGVAALIVSAGFWLWWNAPRIDERLVGTWARIASPNNRASDSAIDRALFETMVPVIFTDDGFCEGLVLWQPSPLTSLAYSGTARLKWSVQRGHLVIRDPLVPRHVSIELFGFVRIPIRDSDPLADFEMIEVEPTQLRLRDVKTKLESKYVRVDDSD